MSYKILIVEDNDTTRKNLSRIIANDGHDVTEASDGESGLAMIRKNKPDLVILDMMLPEIDGLTICRQVKKNKQTANIHIIFLSARGAESDKIVALDAGADDYMTKAGSEFGAGELLARIRAVMRRNSQIPSADEYTFGDMTINASKRVVHKNGVEIKLARLEFDLLLFFARNQGIVFNRATLLQNVWGDTYVEPHTVDVHIKWLRDSIEDNPSEPQLITTVRNVGYRLNKIPKK